MLSKQERKEVRGGIFQAWGLWLLILVLFGTVGTVSKYLGMWGDVTMERIIVKNSFQYKEGMRQQAAIWEAQLVDLDNQAMTCNTDELCAGIEGQKRLVKSRLRAATINQ